MLRLSPLCSSMCVLALVVLGGLAGCGGEEETAAVAVRVKKAGEPIKIAVVPKGTQHAFWKSVESGAREAAKERGVELVWKGPSQENDTSGQIELIQSLMNDASIDGLGVAPTSGKGALVDLLVSAHASGKPVVIFDSGMEAKPAQYTAFVATDNREGGRLGGEEVKRLIGGKGKVVMLRFEANSASTDERAAGFLSAIEGEEGIEQLSVDQEGGTTETTAMEKAKNMADVLAQADAIFTVNESTTYGMLQALEQQGLIGKVKFVGFDTSKALVQALKDGKIDALVAQNPKRMGRVTVMAVVDKLQGKEVQNQVDTGVVVVTRDNLDSPEVRAVLQE